MTIKPALTAEQWKDFDECGFHHAAGIVKYADGDIEIGNTIVPAAYLHPLAALCLHNQPFGFTRADVEALRLIVLRYSNVPDHPLLTSLASRIEALLPPEEDA